MCQTFFYSPCHQPKKSAYTKWLILVAILHVRVGAFVVVMLHVKVPLLRPVGWIVFFPQQKLKPMACRHCRAGCLQSYAERALVPGPASEWMVSTNMFKSMNVYNSTNWCNITTTSLNIIFPFLSRLLARASLFGRSCRSFLHILLTTSLVFITV